MMEIEVFITDVLVVGGGLAGLCSAWEARKHTSKVTLLSKSKVGGSGNTIMTRNGFAAVMEEGYDEDSVKLHIKDTMKGGCYLNNEKLVHVLAKNAREGIEELLEIGVPFLAEKGKLIRKGAPGHSRKRFLTVDGSNIKSTLTQGLAITKILVKKLVEREVNIFDSILVTELIRDKKGFVVGAVGLSREEKKIWVFISASTVLACGGVGGLYAQNTNTSDATGDGCALASQCGVLLRDMEFIQFHPLANLGVHRTVMSTALFADGAVLRNIEGESFMEKYSPEGTMATRDVMARAIYSEIKEGRGTHQGGVYLDLSGISEPVMKEKYLPLEKFLKGKKLLQVTTAAHFSMGGISIDEKCATSMKGLYAAGEVAGGVHGANRLAGNALTETVVFGKVAGKEAGLFAANYGITNIEVDTLEILKRYEYKEAEADNDNEKQLKQMRKKLTQIMNDKVGIIRNNHGLKEALKTILDQQEELNNIEAKGYKILLHYHQLKLMLITAQEICRAALSRNDSLGAHFLEK